MTKIGIANKEFGKTIEKNDGDGVTCMSCSVPQFYALKRECDFIDMHVINVLLNLQYQLIR